MNASIACRKCTPSRAGHPDRHCAGRVRHAAVSPSEPENLVSDARATLSNFIRDPDQTWIQDNLGRAKAVMIAPQIVKAGFIFGGSGGRAVLVARDGRTWATCLLRSATASVGFQAGVEVSQAVIIVMTDKGLNSLLSSSFKLGGDASVAAGPVGAGAKSTVMADLITFTRAKGLYGGVNLDSTVVNTNIAWNDAYYGRKQCAATGHSDPQVCNQSEIGSVPG